MIPSFPLPPPRSSLRSPPLHPYMALLVSPIVNHRGLSRWRQLVFDHWLEDRVYLVHTQAHKPAEEWTPATMGRNLECWPNWHQPHRILCDLLNVLFSLLSTTVPHCYPPIPCLFHHFRFPAWVHQVLGAEEYGEDRQEIKTKEEASTWHRLG